MARFDFDFDDRYRPWLRLVGVSPQNSYVEVDERRLHARFGPWRVTTTLDNIERAAIEGPYKAYRAIGARGSLSDRGATFGTNTRRGVCIVFHKPVKGLDPLGLWRHPNLTVTVADAAGLVSALNVSA